MWRYTLDGGDDPNAIRAAFDHLSDERAGLARDVAEAEEREVCLREEEVPARQMHLDIHVQRWDCWLFVTRFISPHTSYTKFSRHERKK